LLLTEEDKLHSAVGGNACSPAARPILVPRAPTIAPSREPDRELSRVVDGTVVAIAIRRIAIFFQTEKKISQRGLTAGAAHSTIV
jgi:hypothetical protein